MRQATAARVERLPAEHPGERFQFGPGACVEPFVGRARQGRDLRTDRRARRRGALVEAAGERLPHGNRERECAHPPPGTCHAGGGSGLRQAVRLRTVRGKSRGDETGERHLARTADRRAARECRQVAKGKGERGERVRRLGELHSCNL